MISTPDLLERQRLRTAALTFHRRSQGLCPDCGNPVQDGYRCPACQERKRFSSRPDQRDPLVKIAQAVIARAFWDLFIRPSERCSLRAKREAFDFLVNPEDQDLIFWCERAGYVPAKVADGVLALVGPDYDPTIRYPRPRLGMFS